MEEPLVRRASLMPEVWSDSPTPSSTSEALLTLQATLLIQQALEEWREQGAMEELATRQLAGQAARARTEAPEGLVEPGEPEEQAELE